MGTTAKINIALLSFIVTVLSAGGTVVWYASQKANTIDSVQVRTADLHADFKQLKNDVNLMRITVATVEQSTGWLMESQRNISIQINDIAAAARNNRSTSSQTNPDRFNGSLTNRDQ